MFDDNPVQQLGFKNTYRDGKAVGFQILHRNGNYRGLYLSQMSWSVMVDGELFPPEAITLTLKGKTYTLAQAEQTPTVHWGKYDLMQINVAKPGGLSLGVHKVTVNWETGDADENNPRRANEHYEGNDVVDCVIVH
ncbi:MAG: hypothetical protein IT169_05970 [Bryobacterales bacterium]|nr:hypothetical protein [Bryobacterales bacterium]